MLEFVVKDGPSRRIVCMNAATYTYFWPYLFSNAVPGARPLCRWAARHGAAVHGAVRLQMDHKRGCHLRVTRAVPAGRALLSIPCALAPSVASSALRTGTFSGRWVPLDALADLVVRHLHNRASPYRPYLEFLHDLYNSDEELAEEGSWSGRDGVLFRQLEGLYGGNAMAAKGVPNAPFLEKSMLSSPEQRVEWVRTRALQRRLEQSVPYFAAKSVSWAISMVLSRAVPDDEEGLAMYPLIDFCSHDFHPNARLVVCTTPKENQEVGVMWHDDSQPCAHLLTRRALQEGEEVTILYSARGVNSLEDQEYWQMRWGFVPS